MIPPDYSVDAEGPRDICANLAMTLRGIAADAPGEGIGTLVTFIELRAWASRLERACRTLDSEKAPPDERMMEEEIRHTLGGYARLWDWPQTDLESITRAILVTIRAVNSVGAVSPTAPPAEHQEDQ